MNKLKVAVDNIMPLLTITDTKESIMIGNVPVEMSLLRGWLNRAFKSFKRIVFKSTEDMILHHKILNAPMIHANNYQLSTWVFEKPNVPVSTPVFIWEQAEPQSCITHEIVWINPAPSYRSSPYRFRSTRMYWF